MEVRRLQEDLFPFGQQKKRLLFSPQKSPRDTPNQNQRVYVSRVSLKAKQRSQTLHDRAVLVCNLPGVPRIGRLASYAGGMVTTWTSPCEWMGTFLFLLSRGKEEGGSNLDRPRT